MTQGYLLKLRKTATGVWKDVKVFTHPLAAKRAEADELNKVNGCTDFVKLVTLELDQSNP